MTFGQFHVTAHPILWEVWLHPDNDMNGLFSALRRSGYRITQARRAVIESMADEERHNREQDEAME